VLIVDRDDLPANDKWAAALRELGVAVRQVRLPGYVDMVLDPHRARVPAEIVEAVVAFAQTRPVLVASPAPAAPAPPAIALAPRAELASVNEDLVWLDDRLVGVACRPYGEPRRAVILLNSGGIYRIGPNRLYVALARRLALAGDLVLRFDISGISDSTARPGAEENIVYSDHAVGDVGVAVDWCRRHGARTVAVVGLCSGAYHALKAAVAGQPIDTIVPINPLTFFWKPGMPLDFSALRVMLDTARYQKSVTSVESWRKLLRGDVDVRRVARVVAERARSIAEHRARDVARRLRIPLPDDLGSELLALGRRRVAMRFIFASGDPGHAMLLEQGGSAVPRLRESGRLSIDVIAGPDHTFTPRWSHPLLIEAVARALGSR
jgi:hypothetical protein